MAQIIKIGDMWYSDFRINGKRVRRALSRYKPEAERLLDDMVKMRRASRHGEMVDDMAWSLFRSEYLKESKTDKSLNTFYADKRGFEMVDKTTLITSLRQMTPERLNRVRVQLITEQKYKPAAIARSIRAMITAMRWAEDMRYIPMQNWRIVQKKNKEPKGRLDFYERDTYLELLGKLQGIHFTSAMLMGRAGLRLGEALFLEWQDVHFDGQYIQFRSKPHYGWTIKKDVDLKKVRTIPMLTSDLRQHLEAIRRPSGFVIELNHKRREDMYGERLTEALKATGVKTFTGRTGHPHLLRHTFGSHLAQVGVSLKKIAEWMGHESVRMTEDYSHLCPKDVTNDINAVEKLASGFDPVSAKNPEKPLSTFVPLSNSVRDGSVVFGSLDPEKDMINLSSETRVNS